jgi:hypothetical protein
VKGSPASSQRRNRGGQVSFNTYIEVADTCFEGDDGSYRHGGWWYLLWQPGKYGSNWGIRPHRVDDRDEDGGHCNDKVEIENEIAERSF